MKTVGISRLAIMIAVSGMIFASGASGCVVHERTVRHEPHYRPYPVVKVIPYPVIVDRHPKRHWSASPGPWVHGCDKRHRSDDCGPRYHADGRDRQKDHRHRFRDFDG